MNLKPIKELRQDFNLDVNPTSSSIKYFNSLNIDWDVYLPSIGKNLQRDLVWTIDQKRELINSMLIGRHIPNMAILNIVDPTDDRSEIFQIIDGKQRLSTMLDFVNNKFTIVFCDAEYRFSDLPYDYQVTIEKYHFRYYIVNEPFGKPITDEQKIAWFNFINFAGTPQEKEHMDSLKEKIDSLKKKQISPGDSVEVYAPLLSGQKFTEKVKEIGQ